MSRYDSIDERDLYRSLVVQEFGPADVDALDWIAHESPADTTEIDA